jgi:phenylacetic acid degradation protein
MGQYEFEGRRPDIHPEAWVHPEAVLIGAVQVVAGCYIGAGAVLRGDFGDILVGRGSNVQENAVLHASGFHPTVVEDDVVVAHGALLHDCAVHTGAVVGMGAVILHRAVVEKEAYVGAGAVLTPGFVAPERKMVLGNPAQIHKDVSDQLLEINRLGLAAYQELPERCRKGLRRIET